MFLLCILYIHTNLDAKYFLITSYFNVSSLYSLYSHKFKCAFIFATKEFVRVFDALSRLLFLYYGRRTQIIDVVNPATFMWAESIRVPNVVITKTASIYICVK